MKVGGRNLLERKREKQNENRTRKTERGNIMEKRQKENK
jgi:hypothetical protein